MGWMTYLLGTSGSFPRNKVARVYKVVHSYACGTEVKNVWSFPSTTLLCLHFVALNHRNSMTLLDFEDMCHLCFDTGFSMWIKMLYLDIKFCNNKSFEWQIHSTASSYG